MEYKYHALRTRPEGTHSLLLISHWQAHCHMVVPSHPAKTSLIRKERRINGFERQLIIYHQHFCFIFYFLLRERCMSSFIKYSRSSFPFAGLNWSIICKLWFLVFRLWKKSSMTIYIQNTGRSLDFNFCHLFRNVPTFANFHFQKVYRVMSGLGP